jgi:hypothetical protein
MIHDMHFLREVVLPVLFLSYICNARPVLLPHESHSHRNSLVQDSDSSPNFDTQGKAPLLYDVKFDALMTLADAASTSENSISKAGTSSAGRKRKEEQDKVSTDSKDLQIRRKKVEMAWKQNSLDVKELNPQELAQKVRELQVEGIPQDVIRLISARIVCKRRPGQYYQEYLDYQKKSQYKKFNGERYRSKKAEMNEARNTRRLKKVDKERMDRIKQLKDIGIDPDAPIEGLEKAVRGISLPNANELACIRSISWYIGRYRGPNDQALFDRLRKDHMKQKYEHNRASKRQKNNQYESKSH